MGPNTGSALPNYVATMVSIQFSSFFLVWTFLCGSQVDNGKTLAPLLIAPNTLIEVGAWIKPGLGFCENVTQMFNVESVSGTKAGGTAGAIAFVGNNPVATPKGSDGHPKAGVHVTYTLSGSLLASSLFLLFPLLYCSALHAQIRTMKII